MRAGQLRHSITIQQRDPDVAKDASGQPTSSYVRFVDLKAAIEPLLGKEQMSGQAFRSAVTHRVKVRYYAGITPDMRVKFGSRYMNILYIMNINERNRELHLMCEEGMADE